MVIYPRYLLKMSTRTIWYVTVTWGHHPTCKYWEIKNAQIGNHLLLWWIYAILIWGTKLSVACMLSHENGWTAKHDGIPPKEIGRGTISQSFMPPHHQLHTILQLQTGQENLEIAGFKMNPPEPVAPVGSGGISMIPFCGTFNVYYVFSLGGHGQMILAGQI